MVGIRELLHVMRRTREMMDFGMEVIILVWSFFEVGRHGTVLVVVTTSMWLRFPPCWQTALRES